MFVLYDNETNQYMNPDRATQHILLQHAKHYVRRHAAIKQAALANVTRNIPQGWKHIPGVNNNTYQNRPQIEVRELDAQGNILSTTVPLPSWIRV